MAISHYGRRLPILLYKFDSAIGNNNNVNLKIIEEAVKDSSKLKINYKLDEDVERKSSQMQGRSSFKVILEKMDEIISPK